MDTPAFATSRSASVRAAETQVAPVALASDVRALTRPPAPGTSRPSAVGASGARLLSITGDNSPSSLAASRPIETCAAVGSVELTFRSRWRGGSTRTVPQPSHGPSPPRHRGVEASYRSLYRSLCPPWTG